MSPDEMITITIGTFGGSYQITTFARIGTFGTRDR